MSAFHPLRTLARRWGSGLPFIWSVFKAVVVPASLICGSISAQTPDKLTTRSLIHHEVQDWRDGKLIGAGEFQIPLCHLLGHGRFIPPKFALSRYVQTVLNAEVTSTVEVRKRIPVIWQATASTPSVVDFGRTSARAR